MPTVFTTNDLMQHAFWGRYAWSLAHQPDIRACSLTRDQIGLYLERVVDWPPVITLIERNVAHFNQRPIADPVQMQQLFKWYAGSVTVLLSDFKARLIDAIVRVHRGEEVKCQLNEDDIEQAHEKFQRHLARFWGAYEHNSLWGGPRPNVADLAGSANAIIGKRKLDEVELDEVEGVLHQLEI
ncbi:MAG: hypothetical protein P1U32_05985 [Legionellaceae bacterium]|nr:hypothetical protein [Legionellaceae bacterium]